MPYCAGLIVEQLFKEEPLASFHPIQTTGDGQLGANGRGQTRTPAAAEQRRPRNPDGLCATLWLLLRLDIVRCMHGPGTRWAQDRARSLSPKVPQHPGLIPSSSGAGAAPSAVQRPSRVWPCSPLGPRRPGTTLSFRPGDPRGCNELLTSGLHRSQRPAENSLISASEMSPFRYLWAK